MEYPIYIVGHKNPDADSVCSAIAYAAFKKEQGHKNYIAACCGSLNERINTILQQFDVSPPQFLGDVTPRVHDILIPLDKIFKIRQNSTLAEALEIIDQHNIRALPVINDQDEVLGLVSIFQLGEYFIPKPVQYKEMRMIHTSVEAIIRSLNAEVITLKNEKKFEDLFVRVATMSTESFENYAHKEGPAEKSIVVVANRIDIQEKAIDLGVRLLIITGKYEIEPHIAEKAAKKNICLIRSPFDVSSTVWIIRSATPITPIIQKDVISFTSDERLSRIRKALGNPASPIYFVTNESKKLVGIFTKSDILKPIKTNLVLVDHNELSQAVPGAEEVNILEIIDHHRLGNPPTHSPIRFINEPWGSTSTIIAHMFRSNNITPMKNIAGIMMGGMISDTLNLNSPTTTNVDRELLPWLGKIAGIIPEKFAEKIFSSGSVILSSPSNKVIELDCKHYNEGSYKFSVTQVEELGFSNYWKHSQELLNALETYRKKEDLDFSILLVTDIDSQNSILLFKGAYEIMSQINYPQIENQPIFELEGIVSRKKQLIPYISTLISGNI